MHEIKCKRGNVTDTLSQKRPMVVSVSGIDSKNDFKC